MRVVLEAEGEEVGVGGIEGLVSEEARERLGEGGAEVVEGGGIGAVAGLEVFEEGDEVFAVLLGGGDILLLEVGAEEEERDLEDEEEGDAEGEGGGPEEGVARPEEVEEPGEECDEGDREGEEDVGEEDDGEVVEGTAEDEIGDEADEESCE